jgi:6-phosphofructokinase 1
VLYCAEIGKSPEPQYMFEKAGPREQLFFNPSHVTAAIVTCGGLCPGLNDVIRSLFMELYHHYHVSKVWGIRHGYWGLNAQTGPQPVLLNTEMVEDIHHDGGTMLGTSRGEQPIETMVDFLVHYGINMLFCVGGDGTQRGACAITQEIQRRGLQISVIGIPKTIDNDIAYCDRTFGVVTAIEKAHEVIIQAHNEAKAAVRGIGLVKVMGRDAGFIACGAALASQEANFVLIPEVPLRLHGPHGLLEHLRVRMERRAHAVIIAAEGAGQNLMTHFPQERDKSGNLKKLDIGPFLKETILNYFQHPHAPVDVKYIDPSYIVRSVPANSDDRILCDQLARHAVHAAMAGRTNTLICYKNNNFIHVPTPLAVAKRQQVDIHSELWSAVIAATGQPANWHD